MTNLLEFTDNLGCLVAFNPASIDAIAQSDMGTNHTNIWMDGSCTTVLAAYADVLAMWKAERMRTVP